MKCTAEARTRICNSNACIVSSCAAQQSSSTAANGVACSAIGRVLHASMALGHYLRSRDIASMTGGTIQCFNILTYHAQNTHVPPVCSSVIGLGSSLKLCKEDSSTKWAKAEPPASTLTLRQIRSLKVQLLGSLFVQSA